MATFKPWEIGNTLHNVGSHSAAALNADIVTLTAAKGTLEIIPVKVLFESVIVILGLIRVSIIILSHFFYSCPRYGQDEMVDDSAFVELAKYCV